MKLPIKGRRAYQATAIEVYQLILDLPSIAMTFPIIQSVKEPSPGHFLFSFAVDFRMYSGTYQASIYIIDQSPHNYLKLKGTHKSRAARLNIDLEALIQPQGENANELIISGIFEVGGMMKYAGKTVISNGIEFGLKLMFDFLQEQLDERNEVS